MRKLLGLVILVGLLMAPCAQAHCQQRTARVPADVFKAVRTYWKVPADRRKAFDVIAGETGNAFNTTADNGQYENIFQMGYSERKRFGWHVAGDPAWKAARAAYRYWLVSGWSPWECA